jgi:hypothetical protein
MEFVTLGVICVLQTHLVFFCTLVFLEPFVMFMGIACCLRVFNGPLTRVDTTLLCIRINLIIFKNNYKQQVFFLLYLLILNAVITQTCITLLDVHIEKNREDFLFRQITEYATSNTFLRLHPGQASCQSLNIF